MNNRLILLSSASAILIIALIIILTRECQRKKNPSSEITINIDVSPKSGAEPLIANVKVYVKSKMKIREVKIDFNGDKNYEYSTYPNSETFYQEFLTEFIAYDPPENFPLQGTDYWSEVTIYVRASNSAQESEKSEKVQVLWIGPPKFFLVADKCSGPPPLQVNFKVVFEEKPYDRYDFKWDCYGEKKFDKSTTENTFTCNFETIGLYPSSVSVLAPNKRYKISPYIYCGKISDNLISKYIEVLSERVLPQFILSIPNEVEISDIVGDSIVLLGIPGIIIAEGKEIKDFFGVFSLSATESGTQKEIDASKISSFPLNLISSKVWENKVYFSSSYGGTYVWEKETKSIKKLIDHPFSVFPYNSSDFLLIDNLTGNIKVCKDEKFEFCPSTYPPNITSLIDQIKIKRKADELNLVIRYTEGSLEYIKYQGEGKIERRNINVPENFKYPVLKFDFDYPDFFFIPGPGSTIIYRMNANVGDASELNQPDKRNSFSAISILNKDKLILGLSERPCEENPDRPCNIAIFSIPQKSFQLYEGNGNVVQIANEGNFIYYLKSSSALLRRKIIDFGSTVGLSRNEEVLFRLPSGTLSDLQSDEDKVFVLDMNSLILFSYDGNFRGYYFDPSEGVMSALFVSDLIFIGISDNKTTPQKEGKIKVLNKNLEEITSFSDEEISSESINCISALKKGENDYYVFICLNDSISILSLSSGKFNYICESKLDSPGVSVVSDGAKFFVSSYSKLYTISELCRILDSKDSLLTFTQLDIDNERKLLFSSEGENHQFRIWDITSGYPQEITRYSLDVGVEYDVAEGITHIKDSLYLSSSYTGLIVFDISDISKPKLIRKVYITDVSAGLRKCFALKNGSGVACLTGGNQVFFYK
ncbi:hypothetical protein HRbin19_00455 [bacterium HR19]|nr:hypothetical protein HRbin19_00455 [bacterium HR19]